MRGEAGPSCPSRSSRASPGARPARPPLAGCRSTQLRADRDRRAESGAWFENRIGHQPADIPAMGCRIGSSAVKTLLERPGVLLAAAEPVEVPRRCQQHGGRSKANGGAPTSFSPLSSRMAPRTARRTRSGMRRVKWLPMTSGGGQQRPAAHPSQHCEHADQQPRQWPTRAASPRSCLAWPGRHLRTVAADSGHDQRRRGRGGRSPSRTARSPTTLTK